MKLKHGVLCALFAIAVYETDRAHAAFENYNSVLIGDRAAGMGGAYTALSDDPAACAFYNPAAIARMRGHSLSATANVYHKYDTRIGTRADDLSDAPTRINQGVFKSIPASSGSVSAFGNFALGLSIIIPEYDFYAGEVENKVEGGESTNTFMSILDESLWVGGNIALNITETQSVGLTIYYTSRNLQRSVTDQTFSTFTRYTSEEKILAHNSLVYSLGYFQDIGDTWSLGMNFRFPSLEISGRGSYFRSSFDGSLSNTPQMAGANNIGTETRIPMKIALGLAHEIPHKYTWSFDLTYYGSEAYDDMEQGPVSDRIENVPVVNVALGAEYYLKTWLKLRAGAFTNFSSAPPIDRTDRRYSDHIHMWGASANLGVFTNEKVSFSFGGYYTGGAGESTQMIGQRILERNKAKQIFSMLVGSAYFF
ncbi:MAG TPA: outer membrane protein transport protein [Bdellovibrionales bacterium]|nr:outer membrane protein transport protein [Bdellovibrionales bacterium]